MFFNVSFSVCLILPDGFLRHETTSTSLRNIDSLWNDYHVGSCFQALPAEIRKRAEQQGSSVPISTPAPQTMVAPAVTDVRSSKAAELAGSSRRPTMASRSLHRTGGHGDSRP